MIRTPPGVRARPPARLAPALLALALLLASLLGACGPAGDAPESEAAVRAATEDESALRARAREIHERVITLDTHDDISPANFTAERNYTMDLPTQVTLPKMEEGGLDVAWLIVYTGQRELTPEGYADAYAQASEKFDAIHRLTSEIAPGRIGLALTSDDVRRIVGEGRKVAMIGVENGYPVGTDLSRVEEFHERGARYMSLAHNGHSQLADSNTGEALDDWLHGGLSELGRQVVAEMNRVGMMIDVSHPSKEANLEAIALSRAPVMASHSSARALFDHSRNLDDEQLLAIRDNGGVVQAVAFATYLDGDKARAHQDASRRIVEEVAAEEGFEPPGGGGFGRPFFMALRALPEAERDAVYAEYQRIEALAAERIAAEVNPVTPPVDVADFVDHIDYMVELMGIDHVGISSDFDGGGGVFGWEDASETFNVTLELVRRGYTEEEIGKLWSGNLLRVLDEVQAVAREIQAEG
jgi:microsomal dipeptidase-like Zn-dependent dipeptidase